MSEESQPKSPFDIEPFDFSDESKRRDEIERMRNLHEVFRKKIDLYYFELQFAQAMGDQEGIRNSQEKINETIAQLREAAGERFKTKVKSILEAIKQGDGQAEAMNKYEVAFLVGMFKPEKIFYADTPNDDGTKNRMKLFIKFGGLTPESSKYYIPSTGEILSYDDYSEFVRYYIHRGYGGEVELTQNELMSIIFDEDSLGLFASEEQDLNNEE